MTTESAPTPERRDHLTIFGGRSEGSGRVEAFSDGVFAIAITLLVLGLTIPSGLSDGEVWPAIREQGPKFLSAGISFAVIGLYWGSHHHTFRYVERVDGPLMVVNLAHLATIVFLPFPTLVLAEYGDTFTAVTLYAATLTVTGLTAAILWAVACTRHLTVDGLDRDMMVDRLAGLCGTPVIFSVSIGVATVNPTVAMFTWAASAWDRPITAAVSWVLRRSRNH
ncbi:MAG: DUF1211 domain-containing protein [Acidimicrobiia bacterium]|nr:DUF1211 domain-containing protein [Acidimicrobiia bacterium]